MKKVESMTTKKNNDLITHDGKVVRYANTSCCICKKPIYRRPNEIKRGKVYCCNQCKVKGQTKNFYKCPTCKSEFTRTYGGFKKDQPPKNCSISCSNKARAGTNYYGKGTKPKCRVNRQRTLKLKLANARGAACEACGYNKNFFSLETHHIIPKAKGGSDNLSNLQLLCSNCHQAVHCGYGKKEDYIKKYDLHRINYKNRA